MDARACNAVHQRLLSARERGAAVVLISEDLDEVLSLSDRIGVMTRGHIVADGDHEELLERSPIYREIAAERREGFDENGRFDVERALSARDLAERGAQA